jgi:hypothetical protein
LDRAGWSTSRLSHRWEFDIFAATVLWDGAQRHILVQAIENLPLLGMRLMAGHDLRARVEVGGRVEIEAVR